MRIDRLLSITILMLNKERVTARELSEKFEVSIRTIYRDLDALLLAGIPVMSYQGNEGGYGLMDNYKIDRQLLSINEMLSILTSLQSINTSLEDKQYDSVIEKIKSLVPKEKKDDIDKQMEQIIIDFLPWGSNKRQKYNLSDIHRAIVSSKVIEFLYTNNKGERLIRRVEPMTLFFRGYGWYLFAYCMAKKDYRIFRLTRLKDLKILNTSFIRKNRSYKDITLPDGPPGKEIELQIKFSKQARVWIEDIFDYNEIDESSGSSLIVNTIVPEDDWIYPWILSFGDNAEIVEPEHIRNKIGEISKKIYKKYQT